MRALIVIVIFGFATVARAQPPGLTPPAQAPGLTPPMSVVGRW